MDNDHAVSVGFESDDDIFKFIQMTFVLSVISSISHGQRQCVTMMPPTMSQSEHGHAETDCVDCAHSQNFSEIQIDNGTSRCIKCQ